MGNEVIILLGRGKITKNIYSQMRQIEYFVCFRENTSIDLLFSSTRSVTEIAFILMF